MRLDFYVNKRGKLVEVQKIYNNNVGFLDGYAFMEISYVYAPCVPLQITPTILAKTNE